ncbi:MAG TPA: hypothetical protein VEA38_09640 [Terriglobales bacterium]|nr:hypothetical protein [Terriglobales bacterium]
MSRKRQWMILGVLGGVYLLGLGMLVGITNERFRFDATRNELVRQMDETTRRMRGHAMAREHDIEPHRAAPAATPRTEPDAVTWTTYLETMDAALRGNNIATAERAWREAHALALRTRAWRPLAEVGDAALRLGTPDRQRASHVSRARDVYVAALFRARADRSVDGVLHVAEAFGALGDYKVVEECLAIAESLGAAGDGETMSRLRALASRGRRLRATPRVEP